MKHTICSLLATAALGLVPVALAQMTPAPQAPAREGGGPSTRLAALVPAGMSLEDACSGFKNLGQCSATLHAAQNLSIPFADLKGKVTGGESLGSAIHSLKPETDAKGEAGKAQKQAREDMRAPQG